MTPLADNPSLKASLSATMAAAHKRAILGAARETGLETRQFPTECPWTYAQIVDPDFWPT